MLLATRLNSYYDSRISLLAHFPVELDRLWTSLKLPVLKDVEIVFIKEDLRFPPTESIDSLQRDLNPESYMGCLFHFTAARLLTTVE